MSPANRLWFAALGIATVAAILVGVIMRERRRVQRVREEHARSHRDISDAEFVQLIGASGVDAEVAMKVRRGIAAAMGVSPLTVHPSDSLAYVTSSNFDNMDFVEIVMHLEEMLAIRIADETAEKVFAQPALNVAALARFPWMHANGDQTV